MGAFGEQLLLDTLQAPRHGFYLGPMIKIFSLGHASKEAQISGWRYLTASVKWAGGMCGMAGFVTFVDKAILTPLSATSANIPLLARILADQWSPVDTETKKATGVGLSPWSVGFLSWAALFILGPGSRANQGMDRDAAAKSRIHQVVNRNLGGNVPASKDQTGAGNNGTSQAAPKPAETFVGVTPSQSRMLQKAFGSGSKAVDTEREIDARLSKGEKRSGEIVEEAMKKTELQPGQDPTMVRAALSSYVLFRAEQLRLGAPRIGSGLVRANQSEAKPVPAAPQAPAESQAVSGRKAEADPVREATDGYAQTLEQFKKEAVEAPPFGLVQKHEAAQDALAETQRQALKTLEEGYAARDKTAGIDLKAKKQVGQEYLRTKEEVRRGYFEAAEGLRRGFFEAKERAKREKTPATVRAYTPETLPPGIQEQINAVAIGGVTAQHRRMVQSFTPNEVAEIAGLDPAKPKQDPLAKGFSEVEKKFGVPIPDRLRADLLNARDAADQKAYEEALQKVEGEIASGLGLVSKTEEAVDRPTEGLISLLRDNSQAFEKMDREFHNSVKSGFTITIGKKESWYSRKQVEDALNEVERRHLTREVLLGKKQYDVHQDRPELVVVKMRLPEPQQEVVFGVSKERFIEYQLQAEKGALAEQIRQAKPTYLPQLLVDVQKHIEGLEQGWRSQKRVDEKGKPTTDPAFDREVKKEAILEAVESLQIEVIRRLPEEELNGVQTNDLGKNVQRALETRKLNVKVDEALKNLKGQNYDKAETARKFLEEIANTTPGNVYTGTGGQGVVVDFRAWYWATKAVGPKAVSQSPGAPARLLTVNLLEGRLGGRIAHLLEEARKAEADNDAPTAEAALLQASQIATKAFQQSFRKEQGRAPDPARPEDQTAKIQFVEHLFQVFANNPGFTFNEVQRDMAHRWSQMSKKERILAIQAEAASGKTLGYSLVAFLERLNDPKTNLLFIMPSTDEVGAKTSRLPKPQLGFSYAQALNFAGYRVLDLSRALEAARGDNAKMLKVIQEMTDPNVAKVVHYDGLAHAENLFRQHPELRGAFRAFNLTIADEFHGPVRERVEAIVGASEAMPEGLPEYLQASVSQVQAWRDGGEIVRASSRGVMRSERSRRAFLNDPNPRYVELGEGRNRVVIPNEALNRKFELEAGRLDARLKQHRQPGDFIRALQILTAREGEEGLTSSRLLVIRALQRNEDNLRDRALVLLGSPIWKDVWGRWNLEAVDALIPIFFKGEVPKRGTGERISPDQLVPTDPATGVPQWERVQHDPMANWAAAEKFNRLYQTTDGRPLVDPGKQTFQRTVISSGILDPIALNLAENPSAKLLVGSATQPETVQSVFGMKLMVFSQSLLKLKGDSVLSSGRTQATLREVGSEKEALSQITSESLKGFTDGKSAIVVVSDRVGTQDDAVSQIKGRFEKEKYEVLVVLDNQDSMALVRAGARLGNGRTILITNSRVKEAFDPTDPPQGIDLFVLDASRFDALTMAQLLNRVNRNEKQDKGQAYLFVERGRLQEKAIERLGTREEPSFLVDDMTRIFRLEKERIEKGEGIEFAKPTIQQEARANAEGNIQLLERWRNGESLTPEATFKLLAEAQRVQINSDSVVHQLTERGFRRILNDRFKQLIEELPKSPRAFASAEYKRFQGDRVLYGEEAITGEGIGGLAQFDGIWQGVRKAFLGERMGELGYIGRLKEGLPKRFHSRIDQLFETKTFEKYPTLGREAPKAPTRGIMEARDLEEVIAWGHREAKWATSRRSGPLQENLERQLQSVASVKEQVSSPAMRAFLEGNGLVGEATGRISFTGRLALVKHQQFQHDEAFQQWVLTMASAVGLAQPGDDKKIFMAVLGNLLMPLDLELANPEQQRPFAVVLHFFQKKADRNGRLPLSVGQLQQYLHQPDGAQRLAQHLAQDIPVDEEARRSMTLGLFQAEQAGNEETIKDLRRWQKEVVKPEERAFVAAQLERAEARRDEFKDRAEGLSPYWVPSGPLLALVEPRLTRFAKVDGAWADLAKAWDNLRWAAQGTGNVPTPKDLADALESPAKTLEVMERLATKNEEPRKTQIKDRPEYKTNKRLVQFLSYLTQTIDRQQQFVPDKSLDEAFAKTHSVKGDPNEDPKAVEAWRQELRARMATFLAPASKDLLERVDRLVRSGLIRRSAEEVVRAIKAGPAQWHAGYLPALLEWVEKQQRQGKSDEALIQALTGKAHLLAPVVQHLRAEAIRLVFGTAVPTYGDLKAKADTVVQVLSILAARVSPTVEDPVAWARSQVEQELAEMAAKKGNKEAALHHDLAALNAAPSAIFNVHEIRQRFLDRPWTTFERVDPVRKGLFLRLLVVDPGILKTSAGEGIFLHIVEGRVLEDPSGARADLGQVVKEAKEQAMRHQLWAKDAPVRRALESAQLLLDDRLSQEDSEPYRHSPAQQRAEAVVLFGVEAALFEAQDRHLNEPGVPTQVELKNPNGASEPVRAFFEERGRWERFHPDADPHALLLGDAAALWRMEEGTRQEVLGVFEKEDSSYAALLKAVLQKTDGRMMQARGFEAEDLVETIKGRVDRLDRGALGDPIPEAPEADEQLIAWAKGILVHLIKERPALRERPGLQWLNPDELLDWIEVKPDDLEEAVGAAATSQDPKTGKLIISGDRKVLTALKQSGLANFMVEWAGEQGVLQRKSLGALYATFLIPHEITHDLQAIQSAREMTLELKTMDRDSADARSRFIAKHKLDEHQEGLTEEQIWAAITDLENQLRQKGQELNPDNLQHLLLLASRLALIRHTRDELQANRAVYLLLDPAEFRASFAAFFFVTKVLPVEKLMRPGLSMEETLALVAQAIESNSEYADLTSEDRREINRMVHGMAQGGHEGWAGMRYNSPAVDLNPQTADTLKTVMGRFPEATRPRLDLLAASRARLEHQMGVPLEVFLAGAREVPGTQGALHLIHDGLGLALTLAKDGSATQASYATAPKGKPTLLDDGSQAVLQRATSLREVIQRIMPKPLLKISPDGDDPNDPDDDELPDELKLERALLPAARAVYRLAQASSLPEGVDPLDYVVATPKDGVALLGVVGGQPTAKASLEQVQEQQEKLSPTQWAVHAVKSSLAKLAEKDSKFDSRLVGELLKLLETAPSLMVIPPAVEAAVKEALASVNGKVDAPLAPEAKAKLEVSLKEAFTLGELPEAAASITLPQEVRVLDLQRTVGDLTDRYLLPKKMAVYVSETSGRVTGGFVGEVMPGQTGGQAVTITMSLTEGHSLNSGRVAVLVNKSAHSRAEGIRQASFDLGLPDLLKAKHQERYKKYIKPVEAVLKELEPHLVSLQRWARLVALQEAQGTRDAEEIRHRDRFLQGEELLKKQGKTADARGLWEFLRAEVVRPGSEADKIYQAAPGFEATQGLFEAEAGLMRMQNSISPLRVIREDLESLRDEEVDEAYWIRVHHNLRAIAKAAEEEGGKPLAARLQEAKTVEDVEKMLRPLAGKALWGEFKALDGQDYQYAPAEDRFGKVVDTLQTKDKDGKPVTVQFHLASGGDEKVSWEALMSAPGLAQVAGQFAKRQVATQKAMLLGQVGGKGKEAVRQAVKLYKQMGMIRPDAPETEKVLDQMVERLVLGEQLQGWRKLHNDPKSVHLVAVLKDAGTGEVRVVADTIGVPARPYHFNGKNFTPEELEGTYYLDYWGADTNFLEEQGIKGVGMQIRLLWLAQVERFGGQRAAAHVRKIDYEDQIAGKEQGEIGQPGLLMGKWMKHLGMPTEGTLEERGVVHHAGHADKYGTGQDADEFIFELEKMKALNAYRAQPVKAEPAAVEPTVELAPVEPVPAPAVKEDVEVAQATPVPAPKVAPETAAPATVPPVEAPKPEVLPEVPGIRAYSGGIEAAIAAIQAQADQENAQILAQAKAKAVKAVRRIEGKLLTGLEETLYSLEGVDSVKKLFAVYEGLYAQVEQWKADKKSYSLGAVRQLLEDRDALEVIAGNFELDPLESYNLEQWSNLLDEVLTAFLSTQETPLEVSAKRLESSLIEREKKLLSAVIQLAQDRLDSTEIFRGRLRLVTWEELLKTTKQDFRHLGELKPSVNNKILGHFEDERSFRLTIVSQSEAEDLGRREVLGISPSRWQEMAREASSYDRLIEMATRALSIPYALGLELVEERLLGIDAVRQKDASRKQRFSASKEGLGLTEAVWLRIRRGERWVKTVSPVQKVFYLDSWAVDGREVERNKQLRQEMVKVFQNPEGHGKYMARVGLGLREAKYGPHGNRRLFWVYYPREEAVVFLAAVDKGRIFNNPRQFYDQVLAPFALEEKGFEALDKDKLVEIMQDLKSAGLEEAAVTAVQRPEVDLEGMTERAVAEILRSEKLPKILGMPVLPPGVVEEVTAAMREPLTLTALNCALEAAVHYVELRQKLEIGSMVRTQPEKVEDMAHTLATLLLLHAVDGQQGGKSLLYRLAGMEKPAVRVPYTLIAPLLEATHGYRPGLWRAPTLSQSVDVVEQGGAFGTVPGAVYSQYAHTGSDGQPTLYFLAEAAGGPAIGHLQAPTFGHAVTLMDISEELRQQMARLDREDPLARRLWVQGPAVFEFDEDGRLISPAGLEPPTPAFAPSVPVPILPPTHVAAIDLSVLASQQPGNVANVVKPKADQLIRALSVESTPPKAYVEVFGAGTPPRQPMASVLEERNDPGWLNREVEKLAGVYLSGGVTEESFRNFLSAVQELAEEWYGWEDLLQDGGVYRKDAQGKVVLYLKDGRKKRALDCAEINEHLRQVLNGYGIKAELFVGRTSAFTRDVFLKGKFQGRLFRATGVPSMNPLEIGEGATSQWLDEELVSPKTMRRLMAQRGWRPGSPAAIIHMSQLRPGGMAKQSYGSHLLELAGIEREGENLVFTRVSRRIGRKIDGASREVKDISYDRIRVPVRVMMLEADGKSMLGRALMAAGEEAGRQELEEALKKAGATIESSGRSSARMTELIRWMVSVPFDPTPISPKEEERRAPDAVIAAHAGFIRWQAELEILQSNGIVVLPDLLLDRVSDEALEALAVLPAGLASRIRLLGSGWEEFAMARRNPALMVLTEKGALAATLPTGAAVRVVGVGQDDPLVLELSGLLNRAVTAIPVAGGLENFLWMLGRALGLPEKTIRQELNRLTEALASEPVIGRWM